MDTALLYPNPPRRAKKDEWFNAKIVRSCLAGPRVTIIFALCLAFSLAASPSGAQEEGMQESWLTKIPLTGCLKLAPGGKGCADPVLFTQPVPTSWEKVEERFSLKQRIPNPQPGDLRYQTGVISKKEVVTVDLSRQVPKWLALDFRGPRYGSTEPWVQSVGNLLQAFSGYRNNEAGERDALEKLRKGYPLIWEEVKEFLPEWAEDSFLYSPKWDPYKKGSPESADNDGILDPPLILSRAGVTRAGFVSPPKDREIFQACAPIYAPIETILAAENAFRDYPKQVGSNYEEVFPVKDTYFAGKDPTGNPFVVYDVSFKQKPIFLKTLRFVLRQLIHYEDGRLLMENLLVEGDMNYLRLKIFYDPITTTEGRVIGYVKTELLDVDVKTLPMGDKDRIAAVRGDVGNIKLGSEAKTEKGH